VLALAPVLPGGWVLLGELGTKFVACSAQRFAGGVRANATTLQAAVAAAAGEAVVVHVARAGGSGDVFGRANATCGGGSEKKKKGGAPAWTMTCRLSSSSAVSCACGD